MVYITKLTVVIQFTVLDLVKLFPIQSANSLAKLEDVLLMDNDTDAVFFSEVENFFAKLAEHFPSCVLAILMISEACLEAPARHNRAESVFFLNIT